jgi:hypothetical protein
MANVDNLSELAEKLRATRERLEATADRAAALQRRLRTDAPTIISLDKLARNEPPPRPPTAERFEGELSMSSDAWEISLINEEG